MRSYLKETASATKGKKPPSSYAEFKKKLGKRPMTLTAATEAVPLSRIFPSQYQAYNRAVITVNNTFTEGGVPIFDTIPQDANFEQAVNVLVSNRRKIISDSVTSVTEVRQLFANTFDAA